MGREAYIRESLYVDEYLRFENDIFCSSNCNFSRFSAHNLSLLLIFLFFIPNITSGGLFSGGRLIHGRSFPFQ